MRFLKVLFVILIVFFLTFITGLSYQNRDEVVAKSTITSITAPVDFHSNNIDVFIVLTTISFFTFYIFSQLTQISYLTRDMTTNKIIIIPP